MSKREWLLLPLIVLYMLTLLVAAWPTEIRPAVLDAPHMAANRGLWRVGLRPGLAVFGGRVEELEHAIRFRCVVATGTDASGELTLIYPTEPCPRPGFRWRPEIYRHMIFHWLWLIDDAAEPWNLWAMTDHFCHRMPDREFESVTIKIAVGWLSYKTGEVMILPRFVGHEKCR